MTMVRRLIPFLASMLPLVAGPAGAQQTAGDFNGTLAVGPVGLRLGVSLTTGTDGMLTGSMVSPDQSPKPITLNAIRVADGKLMFSAPAIGGRYEGIWDSARAAWQGTWIQGGQPLPLTLSVGKLAPLSRPQEPKPPYPYVETEAIFESIPGVRLAGTFTRPPGAGLFPAVVLVTGSGPQNRDQELYGHKPFWVLADYLTRRGIAVLRYDDRGTAGVNGKSTGDFATATSWDFATDAQAALAWLREQPTIDAGRVGLIGHSEGGLIGPIVAEKDPKLAFLVMLAGPGVPGAILMSAQREATARTMGLSANLVSRGQRIGDAVDRAVMEAKTPEAARATVREILIQAGVAEAAAAAQTAQATTPWYAAFVAYDPGPALAKLRIPLLALNGDTDVQVVSGLHLPAIRTATQANDDVTVVELPSLNHLFQTSPTGDPRDYGKIEETFSPTAMTIIADWILARRARR